MSEKFKTVYGRRAAEEYLRHNPQDIVRLTLCASNQKSVNDSFVAQARQQDIDVEFLDPDRFYKKTHQEKNTQGVFLLVRQKELSEDVLYDHATSGKEKDIVVVLDHIEDPGNLGSILRICGVYGVEMVIIPKDRSAAITPAVEKTSAGALAFVKTVEVVNLNNILKVFKENGYWVVGTSLMEDSQELKRFEFPKKTVLIIGNEHKGMGCLLTKNSDFLIKITTKGKLQSLNAAISAALFINRYFEQW